MPLLPRKIVKVNYRPDIDGLRAVAILAVILYHGHLFLSGGFVGVDVFFVISGYLITQLLVEQLKDKGQLNLQDFYVRRIRRLLPAIFFLIIVCIVLWFKFLLGFPEDTKLFINSIKYSIFGMANIFFAENAGGYFNGASDEMPLLHFWSLAVEEQFYLAYPIFILLINRIFSRQSFDQLLKTIANCLTVAFSISFLCSIY
jgi:peptidoglycan/LPS O-acetylase OafA/YrhL